MTQIRPVVCAALFLLWPALPTLAQTCAESLAKILVFRGAIQPVSNPITLQLIRDLDPSDPHLDLSLWMTFFTRVPSREADLKYLRNQLYALKEFALWFENPGRSENYIETWRKMNVLAASGPDGMSAYVGHYAKVPEKSVVKKSDDQLPGILRNDPKVVADRIKQAIDYIERGETFYHLLLLSGLRPEAYQAAIAGKTHFFWNTPLRDIPSEAWPLNRTVEKGLLHRGAAPEHLEIYLAHLTKEMNAFQNSQSTPMELDAFIRRVGAFYHVAINAMPFFGINNSLIMSQVNFILVSRGLHEIPHGFLDMYAFFISTEKFEDLFLRVVKGEIDGTTI